VKLPSPYKCDYCGKLKEASNHWFLVMPTQGMFRLSVWDEDLKDLESEHVCGLECAGKALAKWGAQ
jgi:hypothetical protein